MELLQLQYFQTVARLEHITKAAEELQIAQPSLSKTIARLEASIGVPLFDRQGRNIRLNPFGKVFLQRVDRIFQELEEGKREVRDMAGLNRGSITLAASIISILPELLSAFLDQYPNVHFRQVLEPTAVLKRMLEDGEIDLCITTAPIEGDGMEWTPLRTENIYLAVHEGHWLAGRESVSLLELQEEKFLGLRQGYWFRAFTDEMCRQGAGFTPNTVFELDEADAVLVLLRKGLGITFVPELAWEKRAALMPHRLRITDHPNSQVTTGLVWSNKHYLSIAAQRFRQFVIDYFQRIN
ncbi:transcriptional regulator, LysR family [Paenibacillus curdlanolyticus YK9]|uniref:Transcriptional regulator, LysR family n=1 Tax=Paenibacillus curdlanolyticus YK9 TaxID=717606 RepID=E0IFX4_9BACL|nr:LysR family transcriptional regulator [Paenibacillus curdlanolyticus]EFM08554.1 transcriptional regulator, LysR family [Paenibacillus curdlanolyticus YK9]